MIEIASTDFYTIQVDQEKNRLLMAYRGSWVKPDQIPNYVSDHAKAIKLLKPGFTCLVDCRKMEAMLLTDFIAQAQKDAIAAGTRKAARVYAGSTFIEVQAAGIHKKTGMNARAFQSVADAEAWLDEP